MQKLRKSAPSAVYLFPNPVVGAVFFIYVVVRSSFDLQIQWSVKHVTFPINARISHGNMQPCFRHIHSCRLLLMLTMKLKLQIVVMLNYKSQNSIELFARSIMKFLKSHGVPFFRSLLACQHFFSFKKIYKKTKTKLIN